MLCTPWTTTGFGAAALQTRVKQATELSRSRVMRSRSMRLPRTDRQSAQKWLFLHQNRSPTGWSSRQLVFWRSALRGGSLCGPTRDRPVCSSSPDNSRYCRHLRRRLCKGQNNQMIIIILLIKHNTHSVHCEHSLQILQMSLGRIFHLSREKM